MAGMPSSMANRAASWRSMPIIRPAVMQMPDRLVPGIRARAWTMPMITASPSRRCSMRRSVMPIWSVTSNSTPKPSVVQPITSRPRMPPG